MRYHVYQFSDKMNNFQFLNPNLPKNGFCGRNFKDLSLDLESPSLRYCVDQLSDKMNNFKFLGPNLPKNWIWGWYFKNLNLDSESASLRYYVHQFVDNTDRFQFLGPIICDIMCTNIQTRWITFSFWIQIYPKMDSGVEISKI